MGRRLGGVGGHLTGRFGWRPPAAGRADRDSGGLEIAARRLANDRRSPLRCGGAASPAAPERESAASCHPPRCWPFRRGTMRSTAASTSWDGATSLAGFQVSTTGRFWVSTEGRNETRRLSLIYLRRSLVTVSRTVTSAFLTPRGSNRASTRVGRDARRAAISCAAFSKVPDPLSSSQSSQVIAAPPPRTNKEGIKRLSSA